MRLRLASLPFVPRLDDEAEVPMSDLLGVFYAAFVYLYELAR